MDIIQLLKFLDAEHSSEQNLGLYDLMHPMQALNMVPCQYEAYVVEKLQVRDGLFEPNRPIPHFRFNKYFVMGLLDD